jgi:hypothetical protein
MKLEGLGPLQSLLTNLTSVTVSVFAFNLLHVSFVDYKYLKDFRKLAPDFRHRVDQQENKL